MKIIAPIILCLSLSGCGLLIPGLVHHPEQNQQNVILAEVEEGVQCNI